MESTDRKSRQRRLTSESGVQTKSGSESEEKSEEYKNFESFANRLGSLTRSELDTILESERKQKERGPRKTRRK